MRLRLRLYTSLVIGLIGLATVTYFSLLGFLYFDQREMLFSNVRKIEYPNVPGVPIQDLRLKTPDNERLQAWYVPPKPGLPIILFLHGKGDSLSVEKWRYIRMHDEGVGFLALAYRGFSASSGSPSERGLFIDGLTAYDWLKSKGYKDRDIVIHGHSLGTGVATYLATQRQARALLLESPFTAASDVASKRYPIFPVDLLMKDKFLNRERIKDVHIPVLIAHGDRDSVIPFSEGERLFQLANAPKVFVRMHNSDHDTLTRDGVYKYYWTFLGLPMTDKAMAELN